ncbi:mitochondrial substrate carrier family protein [Cavenderia fasciculata]|uniref:Mitochondrial substrate carrier family protein n=1 Tax=Cavenderia fasciculata TaxID=261658 RepID=F4PNG9_CACFS|nr:mitochondrial substrate carrier family protein [Cavenderia fasciculata]EGG23022.1 mitochondrial substrate carrier family protein [Cavenderia fasciculata]|eukprot:XP_004360873.1 mitochondrial substrate carrier family protein [Cavenderia fasciculata]
MSNNNHNNNNNKSNDNNDSNSSRSILTSIQNTMNNNNNTVQEIKPDDPDPVAGFAAGVARFLAKKGIAGTLSGIVEETAIYPIDLVKTRVQVHPNPNVGFMSMMKEVYKAEGFKGMFRGLSSPLVASAMVSAIQFSTFEKSNQELEEHRLFKDSPETLRYFVAGGSAGILQSFIICPVDVIKSRMQISGHGHSGSTVDMAKSIYRANGLKGFYTGFSATLLRDVPGLGIYFSTYESLKHVFNVHGHHDLSGGGFIKVLLAGGLAGSVYNASTHCFDIAKTLIQTQTTEPKYKGTFDCLNQVVQKQGVKGLFKGFVPTVIRAIPSHGIALFVYELTQAI